MRNRAGFTLIELLIVVVIIGILAAIAIPKFSSVKQKGYKTQAISDLTSLRTAEETFFVDSNRYGTLAEVADKFSTTSGVGVPAIAPSTSYWSATLTHPQIPGMTCAISVATANPIKTGAGEGEPVCDK
jgi:prepilin-type N-terminal cleavage/methylation domain-containing protein